MSERLTFGYGISGQSGASRDSVTVEQRPTQERPAVESDSPAEARRARSPLSSSERPDAAFIGLMIFTGLLFFRPQDQIRALNPLHLAELSALGALLAMVFGRLGRGLSITRMTPELAGVGVMGGLIILTAPFSIWPSGALHTFTEIYSKIVLIFLLMVNTLTSRKRIEQFIWLIVIASGYIALRAVADAARGVNLVENGRVQGAVGGMFKNPNDLALNMVAVLPLATAVGLRAKTMVGRCGAALAALLMVGAVIGSESRSGTIGLAVMAAVMGLYLVRRRPALAVAGVLALFLALPFVPASYWHRLSSITDESQDDTGSRAARQILLKESFVAFLQNPLTGVGAGQFKNYDPQGREQPWRESHNIVLQVAAELGIVGLGTLLFLIGRGAIASHQVTRLLRRAGGMARRRPGGARDPEAVAVTAAETEWFRGHSAAMAAALAGWFFCALFASVAYNWTFYYLLALATAPREILLDRLGASRPVKALHHPAELREARA